MTQDSIDNLLHKVPVSRRSVVKKLLIGSFVAPVVASFPLDGRLSVTQAMEVSNNTHS